MLIELNVYEENDHNGLCDGVEFFIKSNSKYSDRFEVVDLLQEAIYQALDSADIEVSDEYTYKLSNLKTDVPDKNVGDMITRSLVLDVLCDNCDNTQSVCAHYPCKQYIALEKTTISTTRT